MRINTYVLNPPTPRTSFLFFFNDPATTEIYTLSLHDALPIWAQWRPRGAPFSPNSIVVIRFCRRRLPRRQNRSEEHTSELQSHLNLVCRLLLEKKKNTRKAKELRRRQTQHDDLGL